MFKKDITVKASSNIKSSEKRRIQQVLEAQNQGLKVPNKLSKAVFNTPDIKKGILYFDADSNDPVFFQLRDGTTMIPTLHGLWASIDPNSSELVGLPVILTHDAVIDRLINGANLMIRGCLGPFAEGLSNGAMVAVVNYTRPNVAVAIGQCMMDLEGKTNDTIPRSGVAVEVWTVVGDKLALLGRPMSDVLKQIDAASTDSNDIEVTTENIDEKADENIEEKADDEITNSVQNVHIEEEGLNGAFEQQIETDKSDIEEYVMTTEDIDEMFRRSVLYTLSQEELEFPILASQFISSYILKNLPPVDTNIVNMKKTSWKKTAKFLKAMEKETLIKLKGKDDNLSVISVAPRDDPRVSNFAPYRIKKTTTTSGSGAQISNLADGVSKLIAKRYIKATNPARMFFNKLDEKYDAYYTEKEVKELLQRYIKQNPAVVSKANAQMIDPDSILQEFGIKKPIKRADLSQKVLSKFSPYYAIYKEGDENSEDVLVRKRLLPKRGQLPTINIDIESLKVGNRVVTRISGCERYYIDIDKLSTTVKVKCSGSATITDAKDPKDGKVLIVQGRHETAVLDILCSQWGVPLSVCVLDNKTKLKNRRKR